MGVELLGITAYEDRMIYVNDANKNVCVLMYTHGEFADRTDCPVVVGVICCSVLFY